MHLIEIMGTTSWSTGWAKVTCRAAGSIPSLRRSPILHWKMVDISPWTVVGRESWAGTFCLVDSTVGWITGTPLIRRRGTCYEVPGSWKMRRRRGEIRLWRLEPGIAPRPITGKSRHGIRIVVEPGRGARHLVLRFRCTRFDQWVRQAASLGRSLRAVRETSSSGFRAHRPQPFPPLLGLLHLNWIWMWVSLEGVTRGVAGDEKPRKGPRKSRVPSTKT